MPCPPPSPNLEEPKFFTSSSLSYSTSPQQLLSSAQEQRPLRRWVKMLQKTIKLNFCWYCKISGDRRWTGLGIKDSFVFCGSFFSQHIFDWLLFYFYINVCIWFMVNFAKELSHTKRNINLGGEHSNSRVQQPLQGFSGLSCLSHRLRAWGDPCDGDGQSDLALMACGSVTQDKELTSRPSGLLSAWLHVWRWAGTSCAQWREDQLLWEGLPWCLHWSINYKPWQGVSQRTCLWASMDLWTSPGLHARGPRRPSHRRGEPIKLFFKSSNTFLQVTSRTACEELCLLETAFPCASAEYFQTDQECRLSRESRR